eukprot:CAMPEP_0119134888 /NCGR_PEP_ID=MMETSP1310-20130426/18159_1 /TAXON_ID=464262 /ORGANISM="Genus nov. species nov., Strain RCC2339" /LENGTH=326 /DNA_ID=CAMNT_0007125731 /DNA_START=1 /DNA_END=981 /DNA_ORIENTATION=-
MSLQLVLLLFSIMQLCHCGRHIQTLHHSAQHVRKYDRKGPRAAETDWQNIDFAKCGRDRHKLAFVKTHKVGGSTVVSGLHRWAKECKLAMPPSYKGHMVDVGCDSYPPFNKTYDVIASHTLHIHDTWFRKFPPMSGKAPNSEICDNDDGLWFDQVVRNYGKVLGTPDFTLVLIFRDSWSHMRSALSYYRYISKDLSWEKVKNEPTLWNPEAADFRLLDTQHVDHFISKYLSKTSHYDVFVMLTEEISLSLRMLENKLRLPPFALEPDGIHRPGKYSEDFLQDVDQDIARVSNPLRLDTRLFEAALAVFERQKLTFLGRNLTSEIVL